MRRFLPVVLFAAFVGVSIMGLAAQDELEPTLTPPPILLEATTSLEERTDIRETPFLDATATLPPTLTATASLTPMFMETGSPIATIMPPVDVPAIDFDTQLYDSFDTGPLAIWQIGPGWTLASSDGGQALLGSGTVGPVTLTLPPIADTGLEALVLLERRALVLFARRSEAGDYTLTVDPLGALTLARSGVVIASATVPYPLENGWHNVRWVVSGDRIGVWVDDVPILSATDAAPLPPGAFGFEIAPTRDGAVWIDDVSAVWRGREAPAPTIPPLDLEVDDSSALSSTSSEILQQTPTRDLLFAGAPTLNSSAAVYLWNPSSQLIMPASSAFPVWRLDGREIAYLSGTQTCRFSLRTQTVVQAIVPGVDDGCQTAQSFIPNVPSALFDPVVAPVIASLPSRMAFLRVSPNGSRIDVVVRNLNSSQDSDERNISITIPGVNVALMPTWSPDGKLAFAAGVLNPNLTQALNSFRIYVVSFDQNNVPSAPIISQTGGLFAPFWSASNQLGAISINPAVPLVEVNTTNGALTPLNPLISPKWASVWLPDGTEYASMFYDSTDARFEITAPGVPANTMGFIPKARCPECELTVHRVATTGAWTNEDIHDIADGVQEASYALGLQFDAALTTNRSRDTFIRVYNLSVGPLEFVKDTTTQDYSCIVSFPSITCYALNQLNFYTVVHELGHAFTSRTGGLGVGSTYFGAIANPYNWLTLTPSVRVGAVFDVAARASESIAVTFGNGIFLDSRGDESSDWSRGVRGWGSAANGRYFALAQEPCIFQQNAYRVHTADYALTPGANAAAETLKEQDEAAADLFLNWVFSRTRVGSGFQNTDWSANTVDCTETGTPDSIRRPGDARYFYMVTHVMPLIENRLPTASPTP